MDQGESQYLVTIFFHLAEASGKYQKDAEKCTDKYFIKAIIYRKEAIFCSYVHFRQFLIMYRLFSVVSTENISP